MNIKDKIKLCDLFSEEERVDILSNINSMSEDTLDELEDIVDDYFQSSQFLLQSYKNDIQNELNIIISSNDPNYTQAAIDVKEGLEEIITQTAQALNS